MITKEEIRTILKNRGYQIGYNYTFGFQVWLNGEVVFTPKENKYAGMFQDSEQAHIEIANMFWNFINQPISKDIDEALEKLENYGYIKLATSRENPMLNVVEESLKINKQFDTIKQGIIDRDNRIKELEEELKISNGALENANNDYFKANNKLNAIEEVINSNNEEHADYARKGTLNAYKLGKIKEILGGDNHGQ